MRFAAILLALVSAHAQDTVTFSPTVVTHCNAAGLGRGTVSWSFSEPGQWQIRIGAPGTPMTGPLGPQGSAETGEWVTDGMVFAISDGLHVLAQSSPVIVRCNPAGEVLSPSLASASYFPLQVGDEWVYSFNTRISTSTYITRRITQATYIAGLAWFVLEESSSGSTQVTDSWYRNDDMGRIYQLNSQGAQQLWLDPTTPPDPSATLRITSRGGTVQVPAGSFENSLGYSVVSGGLDLETGTFARGIGLVVNSHDLLTGSSGGFTEGMTLVYAKIDGHVVFGSPMSSLELGVESNRFDVSGMQTANCAVPCYFVACGIGPGADPPGTYKPCFQARVHMQQTGSNLQSCDLDLLDSSNTSLYHVTLSGSSDQQSIVANQVRLYATPNHPFPPGHYQLRAQTPDGRVSIAPIQLQ